MREGIKLMIEENKKFKENFISLMNVFKIK